MPVYWLALVPLAAAAWWDGRARQIPDACVFLLAACGLMNFALSGRTLWDGLAGLLLLGGPLFLCGLFSPSSIGGGDIKLAAALGLLLGPLAGAVLLGTALLAGVMYSVVRQIKRSPLAPFVLPAYLLILMMIRR
jgi:Flp pilus assembly protein protease CpaA